VSKDDLRRFLQQLGYDSDNTEIYSILASFKQNEVCIVNFVLKLSRESSKDFNNRLSAWKEDRLIKAMKSRNEAMMAADSSTITTNVVVSDADNSSNIVVDSVANVTDGDGNSSAADNVSAMDSKVAPLSAPMEVTSTIPKQEPPSNTTIALRDDDFMSIVTCYGRYDIKFVERFSKATYS